MNLRQRLLLMFSMTVIAAVAIVSYVVSLRTREAFAQADQQRTAALVAQFHHEFDRRGMDVQQRLDRMSATEEVSRVTFDLARGGDASAYLNEAGTLAQQYGLDFLELLGADGTIISSAQAPARFGYKEPTNEQEGVFLGVQELPQESAVGLFAAKTIRSGETVFYLVGGERLDQEFLRSLAVPGDTQVLLYRLAEGG
ncbi:MAG TPA: hypothetical protein VF786_11235, partial [Terriglobales bacterium]